MAAPAEPGAINVDELRAVVDAIAAKGGETVEQRRRRQLDEVVRGLGEPVSKPVRALIRAKLQADDDARDLRMALADLQGRYERQQRAHDKLQDLARELAQQNKTIRARYEEQFQAQRDQQEALRQAFQTSMAEIEERIRASNDEHEATRRNQDEMQARIRAVLDLDAQQREFHAQQLRLKDDEIGVLKETLAKTQADLAGEAAGARDAQLLIQEYARRFDQVQASMKENARAFNDLKKHVSNANNKNKAVMKENGRLAALVQAKDRDLAAVKAQFEKFLRRAAAAGADASKDAAAADTSKDAASADTSKDATAADNANDAAAAAAAAAPSDPCSDPA